MDAFTQKSSSLLPITLFKLKLLKIHSIFEMNMSTASKKLKWFGEVKPKAKALRQCKDDAVQKFNYQVSELSRSQWISDNFRCYLKL